MPEANQGNNVTTDDLIFMLGLKDAQIFSLERQVAYLARERAQAQEKAEKDAKKDGAKQGTSVPAEAK
jgi:hypothetical protein